MSYDNIRVIIIDHTPFTGADDNWLDVLRWEVLQTGAGKNGPGKNGPGKNGPGKNGPAEITVLSFGNKGPSDALPMREYLSCRKLLGYQS